MQESRNSNEHESTIHSPELRELIANQISIPRVNIAAETEAAYTVEFDGETYEIAKGDVSEFSMAPSGTSSHGMSMRQEMRHILSLDLISQDEKAPPEFIEVIMLHELREIQYKDAGFEDAHNRALHDEMLYALKYLAPERQKEYFLWSKQYRAARTPNEKPKSDAEVNAFKNETDRNEFLAKRDYFVRSLEQQGFFAVDEKKDRFRKANDMQKVVEISLQFFDRCVEAHRAIVNDWKPRLSRETFELMTDHPLSKEVKHVMGSKGQWNENIDGNHHSTLSVPERNLESLGALYDMAMEDIMKWGSKITDCIDDLIRRNPEQRIIKHGTFTCFWNNSIPLPNSTYRTVKSVISPHESVRINCLGIRGQASEIGYEADEEWFFQKLRQKLEDQQGIVSMRKAKEKIKNTRLIEYGFEIVIPLGQREVVPIVKNCIDETAKEYQAELMRLGREYISGSLMTRISPASS